MSALLRAIALTVGAVTAVTAFTAVPTSATPTTSRNVVHAAAAHSDRHTVTVVFVHGAWADSSGWSGETSRLLAAGYSVRAADTSGKSLSTDVASLDAFLTTITGPVLLVGHSYGGAVITNAAAHAENVVGLVYVDAYEPAVGESVAQLSGARSVTNTLPQSQLFDEVPGAAAGSENVLLTKATYLHHFASDLPEAQATQLWATQTVTSTAALQAPTSDAAWKTLPSWAFISTGDQIITPDAKDSMARRAGSEITTFHGGSHVTFISHPDVVTKAIRRAADSLSGR